MSQITPESIFQVATGFMAAKHLFVANEVGLFEKLAGGSAGLDELAQRTGVHRRSPVISTCLKRRATSSSLQSAKARPKSQF